MTRAKAVALLVQPYRFMKSPRFRVQSIPTLPQSREIPPAHDTGFGADPENRRRFARSWSDRAEYCLCDARHSASTAASESARPRLPTNHEYARKTEQSAPT